MSQVASNVYIHFDGEALEALNYYQSLFGGKLETHTYGGFGADQVSEDKDKLMHGSLTVSPNFIVMSSDRPAHLEYEKPCGFSVSLSGETKEMRQWYSAIAESGSVTMPLEKQAWGDEFGMAVDKFGVNWMFSISAAAGSY